MFDTIYTYLRRRMHAGLGPGMQDDSTFKMELAARLGPSHMAYVQLIDQLLYFEDLTERDG